MVIVPKGKRQVTLDERGVEIGGKRVTLLCGSLFYFRLPREAWKDRVAKLKRAGYNCADVYFPWNYHERADGSFDFTGERDVRAFLEEIKAAGLYVVARPGPYICSEWDGGALPSRILESGMPIRCDDRDFLAETEKWYEAVLTQIAPYTYENGGPVVLLQLENELDFFECPAPEAYVGKLLAMARKYCGDIRCFCCAGQYDVARAGGFTQGVDATLNCYPESLDPTFDGELQAYAFRFAERGKPLLVSETNRDHFLLRRELSCGSKLLGAYNQVAGVNFGYHQAVNNWGEPDCVMVTEYDFESMIDAAGNYTAEAEEAVLFSAAIGTLGEGLAAALPAKERIVPSSCEFVTTEGGLCALELACGGAAVCAPNFSEKGEIRFTYRGREIAAEIGPRRAPFLLVDYPLSVHGIPATLTRANCELIRANGEELVFCAENAPMAGLDFGGGEIVVAENAVLHGVRIRFLTRAQALNELTGAEKLVCGYGSEQLSEIYSAALPAWKELAVREAQNFGAYGVTEGALRYRLETAGKPLFIERPCDILRTDADGKRGETRFATGRDVIVRSADGHYETVVEKWGHCNFDDPQSPSLRISCKKGALSFGTVEREEKIGRCDFHLLDRYGEEELKFAPSFPVRIGVEKWNSTRKPVVCAYSFPATREADRLILKTTENAEVAVYADEKLLGECDFATFELTPYFERGQTRRVTLVYRKKVWTQDVGSVRLLHVDKTLPVRVFALTEKETSAIGGKKERIAFPAALPAERAFCLAVNAEKECYIRFFGKNVKLTCAAGGKIVARLFAGWENAPVFKSNDPARMYFHPSWGKELYVYAEPLGEGAELSGAELIQTR